MQKTDKEFRNQTPENTQSTPETRSPEEAALLTGASGVGRRPKRREVISEIKSYLITRNYDHIRNAFEFSPLVAEEKVDSMDLVRLKKHLQEKFNLPRRSLDNKDEVEEFQETIGSLTDKVLSA